MQDSLKPIPNPIVVLREEADGWALLFNPDNADILMINPTGISIWKMLNGKHSVEDFLEDLTNRFADVPENAIDQVYSFIHSLENRGFVGFEVMSSR